MRHIKTVKQLDDCGETETNPMFAFKLYQPTSLGLTPYPVEHIDHIFREPYLHVLRGGGGGLKYPSSKFSEKMTLVV